MERTEQEIVKKLVGKNGRFSNMEDIKKELKWWKENIEKVEKLLEDNPNANWLYEIEEK